MQKFRLVQILTSFKSIQLLKSIFFTLSPFAQKLFNDVGMKLFFTTRPKVFDKSRYSNFLELVKSAHYPFSIVIYQESGNVLLSTTIKSLIIQYNKVYNHRSNRHFIFTSLIRSISSISVIGSSTLQAYCSFSKRFAYNTAISVCTRPDQHCPAIV